MSVTPMRQRSCGSSAFAACNQNIRDLQVQLESMRDTFTALRLQQKDEQVYALLDANQELMRQVAEALAFGPVI